MLKKRLVIFNFLLIAALVLAGCAQAPAGDDAAAAEIAALEAELAAAEAAGGASDAELAEMQAELDGLSSELTNAESARCTFNAYRMGWVMDWADAGNIVDTVFGADSDFHYTFYQNTYPEEAAAFRALVDAAYNNTDLESRALQWQEAEKMLVEDLVAVIPIQHYARTTLVNTDLNYFFPPFGAPRIAQWSWKTSETVFNTTVGTAVPTLDINRSTDTTSSFNIYQMIDAPYRFNEDGSIAPLAATGFDVSDDGTVFTVHLREGAVWSDGAPVTAQHFVDGIKRLLSPDLANDYAWVMFDIVGAADYNVGDSSTLDSVVAVDDLTFQFTLSEPRSYFDSLLAFSTFHPIRLDVIEANPDDWTSPANFVSNGAYVLVEHNPGENLKYEKNPLYWDAANVAMEEVNVFVITEPATSLAAFEAGETDWVGGGTFPSEDVPRLVDMPEFIRTPRPGTYYMGVNTTAQHTNNLTFRKALASSIDRRTIIENVEEMPWLVEAYGVIPPEIFGYQGDAVGYKYDPEGAVAYLNEYMAEAGIEDAGDIVVELWYNKGNEDILDAVQAMWEDILGVDVRIVTIEWASYLDTLEECNVIGGGGF
ncbi:MAG: ABC transporter substrate-binding protein [Anaerolineales bacterium]